MPRAPQSQGYRRLKEDVWSADYTLETNFEISVEPENPDKPDDDSESLEGILSLIDDLPSDDDDVRTTQAQAYTSQASIEMLTVQRSSPLNKRNGDADEFNKMVQRQPGISPTQTQAGSLSMEPHQKIDDAIYNQSRHSRNLNHPGSAMIELDNNQEGPTITLLRSKLLEELRASLISDFTWETGTPIRRTTASADFEAMEDQQTSTPFIMVSNHRHLGCDENASNESQQTTDDAIDDPRKQKSNPVTFYVEEPEDSPIQTQDRLSLLNQPGLYQIEPDKNNIMVGSNLSSLRIGGILAKITEALDSEIPGDNNCTTQQNNLWSADFDALEEPQAQPELSKTPNQPGPIQVESEDQAGPGEVHEKRGDSTKLRTHQAIVPSCKNRPLTEQDRIQSAYSGVLEDSHPRKKSISSTSSQSSKKRRSKKTGKEFLEQQQPGALEHPNLNTTEAMIHYSPSENSEEPNLNSHPSNVNGACQGGSQANTDNRQAAVETAEGDEHEVGEPQHDVYEHDLQKKEVLEIISRGKRMRSIFSSMRKMNYGLSKESRGFNVKSKSRSSDAAKGEIYYDGAN